MLTGQLGIRLVLLLGKTVPLPAPAPVTGALTKVEVTNDADTGDGFQMTFTLGKAGPLDYGLLQGGALDPFTRVVIGVLLGAAPAVLIDGVITHQQVAPSNEPGLSALTVTGKDVSARLDLKEKNRDFKNQSDSTIVSQVLLDYAPHGLLGPHQITTTANVTTEVQGTVNQHETDLAFVQRRARDNGFVFYVEPVTFGVTRAYWGPPMRTGVLQPALTTGMGAATNLTSLRFAQDALAPTAAEGTFVEPTTKMSLPIPPLPSLRLPPFVARPAPAQRTVLMRDTANQSAGDAATRVLAAVSNAPDAVTGQGEVDTLRYGSVLRARGLVGVRGAGVSYDGAYYVRRVTHTVARGAYTQQFALSREGTGSLLPAVRP